MLPARPSGGLTRGQWVPGPHASLRSGTPAAGHPRTRGRRGHLALERRPEAASLPAFPCSDLRLSTSSGLSRRARGEGTPPSAPAVSRGRRDHPETWRRLPVHGRAHPLGWTRVSGSSRRGRAPGVLAAPGDRFCPGPGIPRVLFCPGHCCVAGSQCKNRQAL